MTKKGAIRLLLWSIVVAFVSISCSKDEDEEFFYLTGNLRFQLDSYVAPGTSVTLEPSGVKHPEGGEITYTWTVVQEGTEDSYTDSTYTFHFTFGTDLISYQITCMANADGYVSSSYAISSAVVKGGFDGSGSLTNSDGKSLLNLSALAYMTDEREEDVRTYYYTSLGGYDWFVQNLAYCGTELDETVGVDYSGCVATTDVFGRYYNFEEALSACPDGWKLPTAEEWDDCLGTSSGDLMGNMYFNRQKMWEFWPVVDITNSSYFSAIPTGEGNLVSMSFSGLAERAVFWTSTESDTDSEKAVVKYVMDDQPEVFDAYMDKASFVASVRCVRKGKSFIPY